jgi:hypothetical protein
MSFLLVMLESGMHCCRRSSDLVSELPYCRQVRVEASAEDDLSVGAT